MKRIAVLLVATFSVFMTFAEITEAHPGRTDSSGGHHCWTNCEKWGLEYGEYHYHNGGGSSSTSSSSRSSYSGSGSTTAPIHTKVDVYINNSWQYYNPNAYVKNGTTLVPMRPIFERLGATVDYDSNTKQITAHKETKKIVITVGNKTAYVNENGITNSIDLSHPAEVFEGSTMVPLRFISEALGAGIEWDSRTSSVYITAK